MKVLVSDNLSEVGIQMFREAQGIEVDVKTGLPPEELKRIIKDYEKYFDEILPGPPVSAQRIYIIWFH